MAYVEITEAMAGAAARVLHEQSKQHPMTLRDVKMALEAAFRAGQIRSEPEQPWTRPGKVKVDLTSDAGVETLLLTVGDAPVDIKGPALHVTRIGVRTP